MAEERLRTQLFEGIKTNSLYDVQRALNAGAKPDMTLKRSNKTAVDYATENNKEDVAILLLANGAKPNMEQYRSMFIYFVEKLSANRLKDIKEALHAIGSYVKQAVFRMAFYELCLKDNLLEKLFKLFDLYEDSCGIHVFSVLAYASEDINIRTLIHASDYFNKILTCALSKHASTEIQLSAIASTVKLIMDEEIELRLIDNGIVAILMSMLTNSSMAPFFSSGGELVEIVLQAICDLSVNDVARSSFEDSGLINLLISCLQSEQESMKVKEQIAKLIWNMLFVDTVRQQLQKTCIMNIMEKMKNSETDSNCSCCFEGALWLFGSPIDIEPYISLQTLAKNVNNFTNTTTGGSQRQIWISYHRSDLVKVISIRSYLKYAGFRVFIDIDRNTSNAISLKQMAKNINESDLIIVCLSHKYKQSPYCHSEAHFAIQKCKKIIPIISQVNYQLSGWLGALFGLLPLLDFSDDNDDINGKMKSLKQEVIHSLTSDHKQTMYARFYANIATKDSEVSLSRAGSDSMIYVNDPTDCAKSVPGSPTPSLTTFTDGRTNTLIKATSSPFYDIRSSKGTLVSNRNFSDWNCENVCYWLQSIGLGAYRESFRNQQICGGSLEQLLWLSTESNQVEYVHRIVETKLGITKFGDALKFITELQRLAG